MSHSADSITTISSIANAALVSKDVQASLQDVLFHSAF